MSYSSTLPLVMAAFRTVHGHNLNAGQALTVVDEPAQPGEVDEAMHRRLYNAHLAVPAADFRPTPVESREAEARRTVTMEDQGGGWWVVNAPWLDKPQKFRGEDAAKAEYDALVTNGRPDAPPTVTGPQDGPGTNPAKSESAQPLDLAAASAQAPEASGGNVGADTTAQAGNGDDKKSSD